MAGTRGAARGSAAASDEQPTDEQQEAREANAGRSEAEAGLLPPPTASGAYGTNEDVKAEGDAIAEKAKSSTGAYAISADASPLTPVDQHTQVVPAAGNPASSTNAFAAFAGQPTHPGDQHVGIEDENGDTVGADDLFDPPQGPATTVTTKTRVYESFKYPGGKTPMKRLLYPKGHRVDLLTAERLKAAVAASQ